MVNSGHRVQQIYICVCVCACVLGLWIYAVLDESEMHVAFLTDEGSMSQSAVGGKSNLSFLKAFQTFKCFIVHATACGASAEPASFLCRLTSSDIKSH